MPFHLSVHELMSVLLSQSRVAPAGITGGQIPGATRLFETLVGHHAQHLQHRKCHQPGG